MRIDEALRLYLSEFRLLGEAPLISSLLEHFAAHWRVKISFFFLKKATNFFFCFLKTKECNNFPFANNDAAFGLAYACIMLNVNRRI